MSYLRGVLHGLVVGTAIGICLAPQEGARTRAQLARAVDALRGGVERAQDSARRVAPTVQGAVQVVGGAVESVRHRFRGEGSVPAGVGTDRGASGSNGSAD